MPLVLNRIVADKQFLVQTAQQGVLACARSSPIPETTQVFVQGCRNKSLKIVEFSLQALGETIKNAPEGMIKLDDKSTIDIIGVLFEIRDKGQARMVKHCDPSLKILKE